jgi:hypothetical protein
MWGVIAATFAASPCGVPGDQACKVQAHEQFENVRINARGVQHPVAKG